MWGGREREGRQLRELAVEGGVFFCSPPCPPSHPHTSFFRIGRDKLPMAALIGAPFGACFEADGRGGVARAPPRASASAEEWDTWTAAADVDGDNANLEDRCTVNQTLTAADVAALKASGARGAGVVDALAAGSATYAAKTELSKAKWRTRKDKKHGLHVRLVKPSAAAVASYFSALKPGASGAGGLRADGVALLLTLGNVGGGGGRFLVVDGVRGVLAAAVAERVGGGAPGAIVTVAGVGAGAPSLDALRAVRLSPAARAAVVTVALGELVEARERGEEEEAAGDAPAPPPSLPTTTAATLHKPAPAAERVARRTAALAAAAGPGFDCAVVAAPGAHPTALLAAILPLLAPSAPLALHSPWLPPLAEAAVGVRGGGLADVAVSEPWWRTQQVLPRRTHPEMSMSGAGGYILIGAKVVAGDGGEGGGAKRQRTEEAGTAAPASAPASAPEPPPVPPPADAEYNAELSD